MIKNRSQRPLVALGRSLPYIAGSIGVLVCLWSATQALNLGLSRLYAARAVAGNDLSVANMAVLLAPSDPEVYRARAAVFAGHGRLDEATVDLTRALALSPRDYELWLKLGDARAEFGDIAGALEAYYEATRLAPYYSRPHWLLGNCLLKTRHLEEAFAELRRASTSKPSLFHDTIELAWRNYNGDPQTVERALTPQTAQQRLALALFFSKHDRPAEAAPLLSDVGSLAADKRLSLLKELLAAGRFVEAYEVWSAGRAEKDAGLSSPSIANGGFEGEIFVDDPGFGWRFALGLKTATASLDVSEPHSGKQSLRLDWHGDPDRSARIVEQLVLVAPKARYRLSFAARTQSLATICAPLISITDGKAEARRLLGQSLPLPQDSNGWRDYSLQFTTADSTQVILVGVIREAGPDGPCPIFGSVWLDDFSLQKM
jgi:tetratricopeptide (TPR) repeat protein